jgi:hypothetical protein
VSSSTFSGAIFEAGVAIGLAPKKTILVRLGPVRTWSDLAGVVVVDLDAADAKTRLFNAIARRNLLPPGAGTIDPEDLPGAFATTARARWDYHDELDDLEERLRNVRIFGSKKVLYDAVAQYAS